MYISRFLFIQLPVTSWILTLEQENLSKYGRSNTQIYDPPFIFNIIEINYKTSKHILKI